MNEAQLIRKRQSIVKKMAVLQEQLDDVNARVIAVLDQKGITSTETDYGKVSIATRHNFSTELSIARAMNATKTEEVLDKNRLKKLVEAGTQVPGHSVTRYLMVKE